ncbi:MAG: prepilin peptidase, partial [Thermodesulfobacteriota bacterium]|nr:prepilin peptidase [Thermodesulfobacteriota bacterium]
MTFLLKLVVFALGLCLGSFLNVIIYRLPKEGQSILTPRRSLCPACQSQIAWYDNLPLLSYILLRGRCRHCQESISLRYPLVELMAGVLTLAVFYKSGISLRAVADLYLVLTLIAITYIDLDEMIIPDIITFPGMAVGLAAAALAPDPGLMLGVRLKGLLVGWGLESGWALSLIGSALGLFLGWVLVWGIFNLYFLLRRQEGIGGGDVTLLAMIGAFLGWRAVLVTIFLGSIAGMAAAIAGSLGGKGFSLQMKIPFGRFLSLGA